MQITLSSFWALANSGIDLSKINLTVDDILLAAALALFLTWLIQAGSRLFRITVSRPAEFDYHPRDLQKLLQKCYLLFPNEIIQFNGKTFKRGMNIRVTTIQKKIIEGKLIGLNSDNMLCLITAKHVVAQELDSIEEMVSVEV